MRNRNLLPSSVIPLFFRKGMSSSGTPGQARGDGKGVGFRFHQTRPAQVYGRCGVCRKIPCPADRLDQARQLFRLHPGSVTDYLERRVREETMGEHGIKGTRDHGG